MALKQRIQAINDLYLDIVSVTTGNRMHNRYALADVYQVTLSAEGYFPRKPISLKTTVPANLRRKVDNTCSLCMNQSDMDGLEASARKTLIEYNHKLKSWLEDNDIKFDDMGRPEYVAVKDLGPTINKI